MNSEKPNLRYITSKVLLGVQHVKELALRSLGEWDSSLLGCAAVSHVYVCASISHVVPSHLCIHCNTQFYQIHTNHAVCSPITCMYKG